MKNSAQPDGGLPGRFPHLGQRIVKTSIAVFLCVLVCHLRGYRGESMNTEAAITAIICMQPFVRKTGEYALDRITGTLIGTVVGLLVLLVLVSFPVFCAQPILAYAMMGLGILLSLYCAVLFRRASASSLAAIVFLCIVISFPDVENPMHNTLQRILDVLIGTAIAIGVNLFRLPRSKDHGLLFFVRTKDLVPDRYAQITPTILFLLNKLIGDGARVCLMSEHAPAYFTAQMGAVRQNTPMIVMDGAAIYDAEENVYLWKKTVTKGAAARLRQVMDKNEISYFIYTIHNQKTCIFHRREMHETELTVYRKLKRSPYRNYLEGEIYDNAEIVYFKIIADETKTAAFEEIMRSTVESLSLRMVHREDPSSPGIHALYVYHEEATMERAEEALMQMLTEDGKTLRPSELRLKNGYRSEHDAIHLLHRLEQQYEPVGLPRRGSRKLAS